MITDRVGILNKGKLLREGTVKELTEKKEEYKIAIEGDTVYTLPADFVLKINLKKMDKDYYSFKVDNTLELNNALDVLRNNGIIIKEMTQQKNTLEEMFISLIKEAEKENVQ